MHALFGPDRCWAATGLCQIVPHSRDRIWNEEGNDRPRGQPDRRSQVARFRSGRSLQPAGSGGDACHVCAASCGSAGNLCGASCKSGQQFPCRDAETSWKIPSQRDYRAGRCGGCGGHSSPPHLRQIRGISEPAWTSCAGFPHRNWRPNRVSCGKAIPYPVDCFSKAPLTLSLSPRGERTLEHPPRVVQGSLLPLGRRTG